MRRILTVLLVLLLTTPAMAQFTIPFTFSPLTRAQSAQVNANFSLLANALDRRGGSMTGDLIAEGIEPGADDTYTLGASDARWSTVYGVLGDFSGTLTANAFSGNGAALTALAETAITDGAILARLAANETVSGSWTFSNPLVASGALTVSGVFTSNDNAVFAGTLEVDNNVTLGDATSDAHTVNGYVNSASGQPGFLAYLTATLVETVDNGETIILGSEAYDTAGNYNAATGVFTAPVAGIYMFCGAAFYADTDSDPVWVDVITTNRYYRLLNNGGCVPANMSAGHTAYLQAGESKLGSVTLEGADGGPTVFTFFSGRLVL